MAPLTPLARVLPLVALAAGCAPRAGTAPSPAAPPTAPAPPADLAPDDLDPGEPSDLDPVSARAALRPARVRPGGAVTLVVRVKVFPSWHLTAPGGPAGPGPATSLRLRLPAGVEPAGPGDDPPAAPGGGYEGVVTFRRPLRVGPGVAPGRLEVGCELRYQACDPFSCRPPAARVLSAAAEVAAGP